MEHGGWLEVAGPLYSGVADSALMKSEGRFLHKIGEKNILKTLRVVAG